jgi:hypothetical protein
VRRTVPPSVEIEQRIDELLAGGIPTADALGALTELAQLGAKLIIQRALEEEFDASSARSATSAEPTRSRAGGSNLASIDGASRI